MTFFLSGAFLGAGAQLLEPGWPPAAAYAESQWWAPTGMADAYLLPMPIISLVLTLIVMGVLLWLVSLIPMDPVILRIIQVVVILSVVVWLAQSFGLFAGPWAGPRAYRGGGCG